MTGQVSREMHRRWWMHVGNVLGAEPAMRCVYGKCVLHRRRARKHNLSSCRGDTVSKFVQACKFLSASEGLCVLRGTTTKNVRTHGRS